MPCHPASPSARRPLPQVLRPYLPVINIHPSLFLWLLDVALDALLGDSAHSQGPQGPLLPLVQRDRGGLHGSSSAFLSEVQRCPRWGQRKEGNPGFCPHLGPKFGVPSFNRTNPLCVGRASPKPSEKASLSFRERAFSSTGLQVHSAGHWKAGAPLGAQERRPLALGVWAWYRPRLGSRLAVCPCGIA